MSTSANDKQPEVLHHDVVIVGGGMGGLYTAHQLVHKYGIKDVLVLEARRGLGGRLVTTTIQEEDGAQKPKYNDFAWRIGETNTMMLQLAKDFGVELVPQFTPKASTKTDAPFYDKTPRSLGKAPLSTFSAASLISTAVADQQDRESGYAGRTAQIAFPGETHGDNNWYAPEGMNAFPQAVAKTLPEGMVLTYHRANDVERCEDGSYKVQVIHSHGLDYTEKTFKCKQVVLAVPPFQARTFTVAHDMQPALFAVNERRLGHIYVQCKQGTLNVPDSSTGPDRIYRMVPDNILQQVVSGDYGHNIFQAGYACDRFERVWRELQFQGNDAVNAEVKKQLAKISGLNLELSSAIEEAYVRILFVHRWQVEAHVLGKDKEELSLQAITPNPARLPGLYLVGEAFSPHQGWTEGAVWTASKASEIISKMHQQQKEATDVAVVSKHCSPISSLDDQSLLYRGLVLDASKWAEIHPGGANPINWLKGHDVTTMFENYHKGWPNPLATVFGLQKGYYYNKDQ